MGNNDLKSMWQNAHISSQEIGYDKVSIEKSMTMKHSKAITKILSDVKLKILVYTLVLIIYIGLMFYALGYLGLNLSVNSLVPLSLVGLFLLFKTTSEVKRLLVLSKTADSVSVKESLLIFRKKLDRIKIVDFVSYLVFLYLTVILIIFSFMKDIGGVKNLSWSNDILPMPLLGFLILMLLLSPWLIRYHHNQRYKKIYSNLSDSTNLLSDNS
jgi:hypothetical protein